MEKLHMQEIVRKLGLGLLTFLGLAQWSMMASAQNADATKLYNSSLAATCANCHGTNGKGVPEGGMPLINGYTSAQLLESLKAYKSGAREGTIMPQLAKGYTDEQLQIIANQLGKKQ
ncbi:MAG: c-type cytochrome [Polynucleobacter sp.]|nr:c-type cytochrome [Polynucleobacter sp.]